MYRVSILRMMVKEGMAEEFEEQAAKQIAIVTEREPGTILYGFLRRDPAGSPLFPKPPAKNTEYIHFMAYKDEEAQRSHVATAQEWWAPKFPQYMDGPWVAERFESPEVVTGVSRDRSWDPSTMHRFALHRFKVHEGKSEEFEEQARKQIEVVSEQEPGTVLYNFFRRVPDGSELLPRSPGGHPEYLHMMAYEDEAAQAHHRELEFRTDTWAWGPVFRTFLEAPLESEGFTSESIVTAVTRDAAWSSTLP